MPCAQADAKDEHGRLRAYLDRGQALSLARGGNAGTPLRGSDQWRDNDLTPCTRSSFGDSPAWCCDCASSGGTRGQGRRPNQDAFAVAHGVCRPDLLLVTVLDGHGPHGHFISRHVRDRLPAWVAASAADGSVQAGVPAWVHRAGSTFLLDDTTGALTKCGSTHGGRSGGGDKAQAPAWAAALSRAYIALDEDLCACRSTLLAASKVTPDTSGCCVVTALVGAGHLVVASCGDSSAFLAIAPPAGAAPPEGATRPPYGVRPFSLPHKPSGEEAKRIKQAGGRIGTMPREEHILRVWPRPPDSSKGKGSSGSGTLGAPGSADFGLAVSRAFGDLHWKSAGVCATPDVAFKPLTPSDAFLVLCTDGVTDVMSAEEVVAVAADALHGGRNAGEAVLEAAKHAWATKWPKHARDDVTVAVVALQPSLWAGGGEGKET